MDEKISISELLTNTDLTAEDRKKDHIEMAFQSRVEGKFVDERFYYEPIFSGHPNPSTFFPPFPIVGKEMRLPIWVSSMTGGTEFAGIINKNLAKACGEFGMGMGLGSCRQLLFEDTFLEDFNVRKYIGDDQPLFANLGIAQIEQILEDGQVQRIRDMISKLSADGLIIHINPLQEWLQPEGDILMYPSVDTIKRLLDQVDFPVIVKEVGQGMGPSSIEALLQLPIAALEFAAAGGTNFSKLEIMRNEDASSFGQITLIGHTAEQMVEYTNDILSTRHNIQCKQVIISGGVGNFLDGYYLTQKINMPAIYGQASAFLKHARGSYEALQSFVHSQAEGLAMANAFLKVKS